MNQTIDTTPIGAASLAAARRLQRRRILRIVGACVVLPTLIVGLYTGVLATRFYESVATLAVEPVGGAAIDARHDAMFLRDFALSHDGLAYLTAHTQYREHFGSSRVDYFSRLSRSAPNDKAFAHYERHVNVDLDTESGFLVLRVRAHSGPEAQRFARALVDAMRERAAGLGVDPPAAPTPTRRLAIVAQPSRPDVIAGPKPLRSIATTLFGSLAILLVATIVISTAREHADV